MMHFQRMREEKEEWKRSVTGRELEGHCSRGEREGRERKRGRERERERERGRQRVETNGGRSHKKYFSLYFKAP